MRGSGPGRFPVLRWKSPPTVCRIRAWHRKMLKKLNNEREKLEEVLIANGHEIVGGTALFVLSRHGGATELWQHLAQAKILTRSFPGKPDWLRFGLPAGRAALNKLNRTLADFYKMD